MNKAGPMRLPAELLLPSVLPQASFLFLNKTLEAIASSLSMPFGFSSVCLVLHVSAFCLLSWIVNSPKEEHST